MSAGLTTDASSLLDGLSPDLLARLLQAQPPQAAPSVDSLLFDRSTLGAPDNAFSGNSGTIVSAQPQQAAAPATAVPSMLGAEPPVMPQMQAAPTNVPLETGAIQKPQTAPPPSGGEEIAAPTAPARASDLSALRPGMSPVSGFDPLTGQPVSGSPQPVSAAPSSTPTADNSPGFLSRLSDPRVYNTLLGVGSGILSGKNFAEGLGQGVQNAAALNAHQGANDLAQAKSRMEQYKLQRELAGQNQTAKIISQKMGIPLEDATALAMNPTYVQGFLSSQFGAQDGRVRNADGTMSVVPGSQQDPTQVAAVATAQRPTPEQTKATAQAQAEGTDAGTPKEPDILSPGQVMLDPDTHQPVAAVPKEVEATADIKNWQEAKRSSGYAGSLQDWINERAQAGRNQTTINMPPQELARDKKVGDAIGTDLADYIGAARPARDKMAALNILEDAWKAGGDKITTGPMADRVLGLKQFARGSLGLNIGDDIAPSELISKIGTQLATADAKSLTARPTQFDFATYLRNNPGLTLTPEGNAALINIKKQQAQHELDLAALARRKENWENWDDVIADYDRKHPINSPLTGRPLGASSVEFPGSQGGGGQGGQPRQDASAQPPQGAPAGARQAGDGNWYVADPNRPGKYLKVQ
ncbi:hypothetical protein [Methylobacterium sp. 1973]|uniref:hypothetical protein n=1 Tax=Methylobacterium sp. 1973 TaxID=3156421 RepID=UPI00339A54E2